MSFGSLEEGKPEEIEVEIQNESRDKFYRLTCPFGCRVFNLKAKLAKAERIEANKL